jgi:CheY-like chemotaxis protein
LATRPSGSCTTTAHRDRGWTIRSGAARRPADPATGLLDVEARLRREHPGARNLLAEDNEISQEVTVTLLEGVGPQVDAANDGEQALALARARSYDLVLMDMQMPRLNGLDATRRIRALPGCADLPMVALTANAFDDDRQAWMAAGMNDYIAKPMDPPNPVRLPVALVGGMA